ncbi:hypothetical protein [Deinococcus sp. QL22]|nr:hypothetical protein [Deinococcus sp. QL22]
MTYAIGTPLNEVEVAALRTLFPQLHFAPMMPFWCGFIRQLA